MRELLFRIYYRAKLTLWTYFYLPKFLHVANTEYKIPARNWMVGIPARIDTSEVRYYGYNRKFARYFYEPVEFDHFIKMASGKHVFFDVGANIGWYSYVSASLGIEKIVAFEFMKEYAEFTKENFKLNNISGVVVNNGVGQPNSKASYADPLAEVSGDLISLDEYAKKNNIWPDIIKMDIEGFELDALKNAHEILLRKPAIDISLHDKFLEDKGQSEMEVLELLYSYGYKTIWEQGGTYFMIAK